MKVSVGFCGVVVITSALHAEGREFEPRQNLGKLLHSSPSGYQKRLTPILFFVLVSIDLPCLLPYLIKIVIKIFVYNVLRSR